MESVGRGEVEGAKRFAPLRRAFLEVFVEHLFPARRMQLGGVGNHAIEVKKHGLVLVAADDAPLALLPHRSNSGYRPTTVSARVRRCRHPSSERPPMTPPAPISSR